MRIQNEKIVKGKKNTLKQKERNEKIRENYRERVS